MPLIKYAEAQFSLNEIHQSDFIAANKRINALLFAPETAEAVEEEARQRFIKFAAQLRKVAPKASDFLYFSAVMLHAAEAALIDQETGEPLKSKDGKPVTAEWLVDSKKGSWKWKCSDQEIRPYKNNNGDIFPETELKKAYRKWVGRPLCKDHQSSSVDGIRGIIVDTVYDDKFKRVIGLCALDKINYPDLARKVSTGYANNVSMGTAVGRSICYECGNVAKVEADYCIHVRGRTTYGEINIDLSPIELSLVVTGADPRAQLRSVIASLNKYSEEKQDRIDELRKAGCVTIGEFDRLAAELEDLRNTVKGLDATLVKSAAIDPEKRKEALELSEILSRSPGLSPQTKEKLTRTIEDLLQPETEEIVPPYGMTGSKTMGGEKAQVGRDETGTPPEYALENRENRLASANELELQIKTINDKLGAMQNALRDLAKGVQEARINKEGQKMSDKKLRERAAARRATFQKAAYFQGGGGLNEPQTYPVDPMNDKLKTDGDKQMEGQGMEPGNDGLHPGYDSFGMSEEALKQKLSRAELEERKLRRHAVLATAEGEKKVYELNGKKYVAEGDKLVELKAEDAPATKKEAYFQGGGGLNEPSKPGTPKYPVDPMNDKLKTDGDKQMEGQGMEPGNDGLHPGYQSYGDELKLKEKLLRADEKLRAKFVVAYKNDEGTVIDKDNSRWEIYAGKDKILEATGKEIYEDELEKNWDILASKRYGLEVLRAIREEGFERVAYLLKGDMVKTAQEPPMPPMPPMPPAGGPEAGAPPAGGPPVGLPEPPKEEEKGKDDKEPVDQALETLDKSLEDAEKALGDLKDTLQETTGKAETELPSPAEADDEDEDADDGEQLAVAELSSRVKEVYAALDESADEIAMLAESLESRAKAGKTASDAITAELLRLAADAVRENDDIRSEATLIIDAAKKKEKDEEEEEDKKGKKEKKEKGKKKDEEKDEDKKEKKDKGKKKEKKLPWEKDEEDEDEEDEGEDKKEKKSKKSKAEQALENLLMARAAKRREVVRQAQEEPQVELTENEPEVSVESAAFDVDDDDVDIAALKEEVQGLKDMIKQLTEGESEASDEMCLGESEMDLDDELSNLLDDGIETTAEDRRAWRAKVAAEVGTKYQLSLNPAACCETDMPLAPSLQLGQLDTKPSDEGAKVESIEEQYEKIMKEVESVPQVREAMEHIVALLKSGAIQENDLDNVEKLTALAVDPEAAKYFKQYFGLGDADSKQFGTEMVKEFVAKKAAADKEEQRVMMRRAYDMALEMQDKNMIPADVATLHKQVDEIMQFDKKSFESFKRALSRVNKQTKTASPALQVGIKSPEELGEGSSAGAPDLTSQLKKLWK
jgi:hypothetical protein